MIWSSRNLYNICGEIADVRRQGSWGLITPYLQPGWMIGASTEHGLTMKEVRLTWQNSGQLRIGYVDPFLTRARR